MDDPSSKATTATRHLRIGWIAPLMLLTAAAAAAQVTLKTATNGQDADAPPGPTLAVGSSVTWTYVVSNIGGRDLVNVAVTDDQGVVVTCPATVLGAGESMTCTATGTAQAGQYANIGTVTADEQGGGPVTASDPSHYLGVPAGGQILGIKKSTNGQDADLPPGPSIAVGTPVTWTYVVTNPGPAPVSALSVTDDQGVAVSCPATTLAVGASMTCTGSGMAQPGQYSNLGTASGRLPDGTAVIGSDASHYLGVVVELTLKKFTNGEDADQPPGPVLAIGAAVTWTYVVTNTGTQPLTEVSVVDDQGVVVTCPETTLAVGESMTCTGSGTAQPGQYANLGTASGTRPDLKQASASDPSHYFGQDQVLDFGSAPDPPYPTRFAADGARHRLGSNVYLGACVIAELDGPDGGVGTATFGTCAVPGQDQDGVSILGPLTLGTTQTVYVTANAACTLSAWIDLNRDGDWSDAGEELFPGGQALAAGVNPLSVPVPLGGVAGATFARFRCTTDGPVTPTGLATDGEVEDYAVVLTTGAPIVTPTKTAALAVDADGDGTADPGDTLLYTVTVLNGGSGPATAVTFTDTPDTHTTLVAGSVTTTQGTVTSGNGGGDTTVGVALGNLAPRATVTITFRVRIDNPLPAGVGTVSNQGTVTGGNFSAVTTDDPGAPGTADPTVVAVALPVVEIPTLGGWGLLALSLLLGGYGLRALRR